MIVSKPTYPDTSPTSGQSVRFFPDKTESLRTLQLQGIVWYGMVSIPEKLSLILDASEFEFVIVDSVGVLGRDFRSFRFPLNFNRRSQLVDDGLSNESFITSSVWQSANVLPRRR